MFAEVNETETSLVLYHSKGWPLFQIETWVHPQSPPGPGFLLGFWWFYLWGIFFLICNNHKTQNEKTSSQAVASSSSSSSARSYSSPPFSPPSRWRLFQRYLPSLIHSLYVSWFLGSRVFLGGSGFSWEEIENLQVFSSAYLIASTFVEARVLTNNDIRHHLVTAHFLLLPRLIPEARSPFILWLNLLGLALECTTPFLNALKIFGTLDKLRARRSQSKKHAQAQAQAQHKGEEEATGEKKGQGQITDLESEKEENLMDHLSQPLGEGERIFTLCFLFYFGLWRVLFPIYILVAVSSCWVFALAEKPASEMNENTVRDLNWTAYYILCWLLFVIMQVDNFRKLCSLALTTSVKREKNEKTA